jgi:hypothetical protein
VRAALAALIAPYFTLTMYTAAGDGVHVIVPAWGGPGTYTSGAALVHDGASLVECNRGSKLCYQAKGGCSIVVDAWSLGETIPGARAGTGHGTVTCAGLQNDDRRSVRVANGQFTCRATDWH